MASLTAYLICLLLLCLWAAVWSAVERNRKPRFTGR